MHSEFHVSDAVIDQRVVAVLETAAKVEIPAGFAARVAAEAVARHGVSQRAVYVKHRYGPLALYGALVVLVAAMLLAARFVGPGGTFVVECTLVAEFAGLGLCLGLAPELLR